MPQLFDTFVPCIAVAYCYYVTHMVVVRLSTEMFVNRLDIIVDVLLLLSLWIDSETEVHIVL